MNIIDIISKEVKLKRIGEGKWRGYCPFHDDNGTPNFTVYEDTNSYYCFACKKYGTIYDWAKEKNLNIDLKLEFKEDWKKENSRIALLISDKLREVRQKDKRKWFLLMKKIFKLLRREMNEDQRRQLYQRIIAIR